MGSGKYILENGAVRREDDLMIWAEFMEKDNRRIERTEIGDVSISTVFLGLDHSFNEEAIPVLFETMIFGGDHDGYQERYTDIENAKIGHEKAVKLVKGG